MKISKISNITKLPLIMLPLLLMPSEVGDSRLSKDIIRFQQASQYLPKTFQKNDFKILEGLEITKETNFVGGIYNKFTDSSIKVLKQRISRPDSLITYTSPFNIDKNTYTEPFGYFFAKRPAGKNKFRPHLGLDIFFSKYARKPKEPIKLYSPIDGVVISQKVANPDNNLVGNNITILGVDGRQYSFDHLARPDDYKTSIQLPKLGTILKAGDEIGYVGSTGETTMWHLHLVVSTDEELEAQQKSPFWQKLSRESKYNKLNGQVNPLDRNSAGPIADILCKIKGTKPSALGNFNTKQYK